MGSRNHREFVQQHQEKFEGPVLEVGSKDYGNTENLRSLFSGETYVGIDMEAGKGVDHVLDLTRPFEEIEATLNGQRFRTIFCLSVLEHCSQPFAMADNMTRLLEPDGRIYVSVPFAWKFHGYPSDYWRFTHEGVKQLFPNIEFDVNCSSTTTIGDFRDVDNDLCRIQVKGSSHRRQGRYLRSLTADVLQLMGTLGPLRWLTQYRYLMPPTMIDMVGHLQPSFQPPAPVAARPHRERTAVAP